MDGEHHKRITEITNPMLQMAKSKGGDALLSFSIDQVLKNAGPRQAEVLRRCAVVRWFDPSVLAVLRESNEGNERVMDLLRSYSFVRELGDGRLAYHDQVRKTLLESWRQERADELRQLHLRLYAYFSERTTPPGKLRMPKTAGSAMLAVPISENRELWRREALYHLLCADTQRGMAELRSSFEELESVHRLADAESLLQVAADTPLGRQEQLWLHYLRAQVQQSALRLDAATEQFQTLLAQPDLSSELVAQARRSLGEVLAENGQWARATEYYRESLAYFRDQNDARAVADTLMLLGEAYQGIGVNTGSWHVSLLTTYPVLRILVLIWEWLLGLPFQIIGVFLRATPYYLPVPRYCARYQNWLLIRLYNTARTAYIQARDAYEDLHDERGLLRAKQRLADIRLLYGYPREAMDQINALLKEPLAQDAYRRAWLYRSLADCHLEVGDVGSAQVLLAEALEVFRDLADVRREASVLALQGRAAAMAGNNEGALRSYRDSLNQFRSLRYIAAREKILHNLRAWRRGIGVKSPVGQQISALINAEPEKRYVGRFIRSHLPLLQLASLMALPLALIVLGFFVPTQVVDTLAGGTISVRTFYNPLHALGVMLILVPLYMVSYLLLAFTVIYFLPILQIEREQPDMITTTPQQLARYDSKGNLVKQIAWTNVRQWYSLDRCIWERPLPLYSRTFLEDAEGFDLRIDGITGWYGDLQNDIALRLNQTNSEVQRIDLGYTLLRSKSGAATVLGSLLWLVFTWSANGWVPLLNFLPPTLYTLLHMFALSSTLLLVPAAYWLATRPLKLQRALELDDRWPYLVAILGALPVIIYVLGRGEALPIRILNVSTFVWGCYMLIEALVALIIPARRQLRRFIVVLVLLLSLLVTAQPSYIIFNELLGSFAKYRAQDLIVQAEATPGLPGDILRGEAVATASSGFNAADQAQQAGGDRYENFVTQGDNAFIVGQYDIAVERYQLALKWVTPGSPQEALVLYNLNLAYKAQGNDAAAAQSLRDAQAICADPAHGTDQICERIMR